MNPQDLNRLIEICKLAANEQDPQKFHKLLQEMNRIFEAKEQRLRNSPAKLTSE